MLGYLNDAEKDGRKQLSKLTDSAGTKPADKGHLDEDGFGDRRSLFALCKLAEK